MTFLPSGIRLGPYKIEALIGAGGMGEVYRAIDTRLNRDVAIKILCSDLTAEPGAMQRFEREAHAASALNDPHEAHAGIYLGGGSVAAAAGETARVRDWQFLINEKPDNPPTIRDYKP